MSVFHVSDGKNPGRFCLFSRPDSLRIFQISAAPGVRRDREARFGSTAAPRALVSLTESDRAVTREPSNPREKRSASLELARAVGNTIRRVIVAPPHIRRRDVAEVGSTTQAAAA